MTSDAKVGLLLGLFFIFLIALVINGVPKLREDTNNNELTTNMTSSYRESSGLAVKERKAYSEVVEHMRPIKEQAHSETKKVSDNKIVRFSAPLPGDSSAAEDVNRSVGDKLSSVRTTKPSIAEKGKVSKPEFVRSTRLKVYVVCEGDSLSVIANKFYGLEEGNKKANVSRIFEANRKVLKSPDDIYVGQRLVIPPLSTLVSQKGEIKGTFSSTMFKKVKSVGQRYFQPNGHRGKKGQVYVVQEGDSLWKIAAEQLGDGSRYRRIAKLNSSVMEDENNLVVGMRLRLPVR